MNKLLTELEKAKSEGFTTEFFLSAGVLHTLQYPERKYRVEETKRVYAVCPLTKSLIYRITTHNGIRGTLVLDYADVEESGYTLINHL